MCRTNRPQRIGKHPDHPDETMYLPNLGTPAQRHWDRALSDIDYDNDLISLRCSKAALPERELAGWSQHDFHEMSKFAQATALNGSFQFPGEKKQEVRLEETQSGLLVAPWVASMFREHRDEGERQVAHDYLDLERPVGLAKGRPRSWKVFN